VPIRSQEKNAVAAKKVSGWDQAIADAKRKIKELQFSVRVFTQRRDKGEQWPGDRLSRPAGVQELDGKRHANG
jgi:hypothetical protein